MSKKELAGRYGLCIIGLFFSALGVAFTKHGELGVSPISSVANVMSIKFTALSMGSWLIVWNCILILGQILILRKKFQPVQLLQLPLSLVFGWFTDLGLRMVSFIPTDSYIVQLLLVIVGIVILGFGIALSVAANVIMNSGEAFVKAVADTVDKQFGNVKIVFDVINVALALLLSLLFFNFTIQGVREGTVISALCTGIVVKFFSQRFDAPLNRILRGEKVAL